MARQMKDSGIEWIGEIPETWQRDKVVRTFSLIGSGTTPKSTGEEQYGGTINWIQSGDINGGFMSFCKNTITEQTLQEYSALKVYQAPFIILAMYGASVGNLSISAIDGCVNQACCVLSMSKCNFQYAFYTLKAAKEYLLQKAVGGGQPNISQDIIRSLWMPQPELEEQQRIASFLDRKCAEIDAVIERTKVTIEEYKKLKQAVITEAVTKGVRGPRPMKDSGIEWIGEIPVSFEKFRVKHVTDVHGRIGFRGYTTDDMVDAGEGAITLSPSNIRDMSMNYDKCSYISWEKYSESPEIQIHDGDLLMVKTGSSYGKTALVANLPMEATINPQLIVMNNFRVIPQFLNYYFHTYVVLSQIENAVVGGTIPTMAQEKINNFYFFAPDLEEQQEIAACLNEKCAALDILIAKKTALLTELETYKKSLIYEYVTGKKEVGE